MSCSDNGSGPLLPQSRTRRVFGSSQTTKSLRGISPTFGHIRLGVKRVSLTKVTSSGSAGPRRRRLHIAEINARRKLATCFHRANSWGSSRRLVDRHVEDILVPGPQTEAAVVNHCAYPLRGSADPLPTACPAAAPA